MAGLLVYLPGATRSDAAELVSRGCGELLEPGVTPLMFPAGRVTPDGGQGLLVSFDDARIAQSPSYTPREIDLDQQQWIAAPRAGGAHPYWVGIVRGEAPGPSELARRSICDGLPVQCGDKQPWIVPIADYLPKRLSRDPQSGREISVPLAVHRDFTERANELFRHFMSDDFQAIAAREHRITIPGGLAFAGVALAKNYRVNATVVDLLELVDEYVAFEIARVACGLPALETLAKKHLAS
jgi:hypothetical protein